MCSFRLHSYPGVRHMPGAWCPRRSCVLSVLMPSMLFWTGYPTGAVRVSFGYMSGFEDADAVIRVLHDFFVSAEADSGHDLPSLPNSNTASPTAGNAVSSGGKPSLQGATGSRAPCGCLLPPGAVSTLTSSSAPAEPAVGAQQQQHSAAGASLSSRGASAMAAPQQGGDAGGVPGSTEKESAWDRIFAVVSSPEEPGTPTREEGAGGFGRVSAMQTVLKALGTEPAAAPAVEQASEGSSVARRGAMAIDGLRVQGLCLYPIKSCAAQVPRLALAASYHHGYQVAVWRKTEQPGAWRFPCALYPPWCHAS